MPDRDPDPDATAAPSAGGRQRDESVPDRLARWLRGFGPLWVLSFLVIALGSAIFTGLGALLVLLWAYASNTPLRELGFVRPRSWGRTLLAGIALGVVSKLAMKSIVMPLLGAPPINAAFHHLAGDRAAIPGFVFQLVVGAGFGEETLYRGYLFERLGRLFGAQPAGRAATVLASTALFAAAHYTGQGVPGVQQAFCTGLLFAGIFAVTGRLPLLMIGHAAFDLTAYGLIYNDLETTVAHWFFR